MSEDSLSYSGESSSPVVQHRQGNDDIDEDWEEWDGVSPFWIHCAAGSLAGVVEHTAVYPLDTVRTHIQVCASCIQRGSPSSSSPSAAISSAVHSSKFRATAASATEQSLLRGGRRPIPKRLPMGMLQTFRYLVNESAVAIAVPRDAAATAATTGATKSASAWQGWARLWRGAASVMMGCVPAHALYFSSYELVKDATLDKRTGQVTALGSSLAGAAATCSHDLIMTPLDTVKQRMQLGHYDGVSSALVSIMKQEGWRALYRSYTVTLATNVPYGMIMVSTNEFCKKAWGGGGDPNRPPSWQVVLAASSAAGFTASALTTPLDRIKTALQTQELAPACWGQKPGCELSKVQPTVVRHANWREAATTIWKNEGPRGFCRGMLPRLLSHTPAVAISWTTYETAKQALMQHYA